MKQFIFGLALFLIGMVGWVIAAGLQGIYWPWLLLYCIGMFIAGILLYCIGMFIAERTLSVDVKPSQPNGLVTKKFVLPDVMDDQPAINCSVEVGQEFCFHADGYGDSCSQDGYGSAVVIENKSGVLTLYVYNDINEQEPIVISLENAKESNRK
jgi:hypothetical protein